METDRWLRGTRLGLSRRVTLVLQLLLQDATVDVRSLWALLRTVDFKANTQ